MCIPVVCTTAYTSPVDQDHFTMKDCPSPTPEASKSSSLALHNWEHLRIEIWSFPDPTVFLSELHFIGKAIWSHNYFFQVLFNTSGSLLEDTEIAGYPRYTHSSFQLEGRKSLLPTWLTSTSTCCFTPSSTKMVCPYLLDAAALQDPFIP